MKGRSLETMTWLEAERALQDGRVVLIPLGARLKEHGPHLPLNNDWILAERLARKVIERADVLAAPTVEFGYYPAFTEYPGSVTLSLETARDLIVDVGRSLGRHGARKLYVLNTGISTVKSLEPARQLLRAEGVTMEFTDLGPTLAAVEASVRESEGGTHADEIETSMMLYLAPEIVRMNEAKRDYHPFRGGGLTRRPDAERGTYSPTGTWGDPTSATAEKGRVVVEALVDHVVDFLARFAAPDFVPTR